MWLLHHSLWQRGQCPDVLRHQHGEPRVTPAGGNHSVQHPSTAQLYHPVHGTEPSVRIALGTQTGEIVLLDPSNIRTSISSVSIKKDISVQSIQWYGPVAKCFTRDGGSYNSQSLSAYLENGTVVLIKSVSSPHCVYSQTGVHNGVMALIVSTSSYSRLFKR